MAHGDDSGLMMPPNVAPHQVIVVPIWRKDEDKERQQYEHDGRSKEGKKYNNKDEYVLYQAQYYVEKTGGGEGGNESRG